MSEEVAVVDGFQVSSVGMTAKEIKANLEADEAPKDGTPEDAEEAKAKSEKESRSKAAAELGRAGGKAASESRKGKAEAGESPGEDEVEDEAPEIKAKPKPEEDDETSADDDNLRGIEGNPRRNAKARIQQLARERAEVKAKLAAAEERLARLEAERAAPKASEAPQSAPKAPTGDGEPDVASFETYEEYVKAVARHAAKQERATALREMEAERRAEAHGQEIVKRVETFRQKVTPDVLERVDPRLLDLKTTFMLQPGEAAGPLNVLADELITSDVAPQLMLYLSEHEEVVRDILSAPNPVELARRVGRVEARLTGEPAPPPPQTVSKAKPPIQPLSTSPAVSDDLPADDMDFDSYKRIMDAREKRGRR